MRLFTKDADGKPDTPISIWVGLIFVGLAIGMKSAKIGPGPLSPSWELGMPAFMLIVGLVALVPGLLLTLLREPESN